VGALLTEPGRREELLPLALPIAAAGAALSAAVW
jgi:hypothetical protein